MDFQHASWAICSAYVNDLDSTIIGGKSRIQGWVRSRAFSKIVSCSSQFPGILSREEMRAYMQIESFFKKNASFVTPSTKETTLRNFHEGEKRCRITNRRLDHYHSKQERLAPDLRRWLAIMKRRIESTLGPCKTFLDEIPELVRLTSGASSTRSRAESLPPTKVGEKMYVTHRCSKYVLGLASLWGYEGITPKYVDWNRVEFVPKNWKTGRGIACEPDGNLPFQLAFDHYAKVRLRRKLGVDLANQTMNQKLAKQASIDDLMATVDLSMASDTLAINVLAWLLDDEWYTFLDDVRCPRYRLPGGAEGVYAKFSSMGNGATFALETLVFTCAAIAVGSTKYSVYGDDIIIEAELVDNLKRLLSFLGFSLNSEKSFVAGPFRESCGGNFYEGVDITPFYIREFDRRRAVLCHNVNGLASVAKPGGHLWEYLLRFVREWKLPVGPWCEDSLAYVWIPPYYAYELGKISLHKTQHYLRAKAFGQKSEKKRFNRSSLQFLWHLKARQKRRTVHPEILGIYEFRESRGYSQSQHRYIRRWRRWEVPAEAAPPHLWWWGESIMLGQTKP